MTTKGYPQHLTDTNVNLYNGTSISIHNGTVSPRFESTNQGVRKDALSHQSYLIYMY
jgi:hypothetical protein